MKKILILVLAAVIMSFPTHAAEPAKIELKPGDVLRGQFTEERHMQGFKGPMTSQGHFVVAPGYGLIWNTEKPFAIATIITPNGLTQDIDGSQVTNLPTKKLPFLLHLYEALGGALAGDWQAMDKDFTSSHTATSDHWQVDLKPRQADNIAMPFAAITVKGGRFAENVHMVKTDGDSEDIIFHNQAVSHGPPSSAELMAFGVQSP